jgi:hypothetical protein
MKKDKAIGSVGWCPDHRKLLYTDRKRAKLILRRHVDHKNIYRCPTHPGMFHIGGLPKEVISGEMTRDEFFKKRAS